jgi:hypothetical protein
MQIPIDWDQDPQFFAGMEQMWSRLSWVLPGWLQGVFFLGKVHIQLITREDFRPSEQFDGSGNPAWNQFWDWQSWWPDS